jgi:mRNA interferase MazF
VSPAPRIAPWQLWWVDLGQPIGHEQGGRRPAVVVGSTVHCQFPIGMALVVPLTTRDRGMRHHVRISSPSSGLSQPSWARPEDMRAISTRRFSEPGLIGTASAEEITVLSDWLREMVAFVD